MPPAETMPERIKGALRAAGLTVAGLAEEWGISRPAFSTRINSGEMDEAELVRLAQRTRTTPAYLRYGIRGDFADGVRWAVLQMRGQLDELVTQTAAPTMGAADEDDDDAVAGIPIDEDEYGEEATGSAPAPAPRRRGRAS